MPRISVSTNAAIALGLVLLSFGVYLSTSSPTINFWDCGEFVATAFGLGIPHQPGTPLYVLVGRVFSILPILGLSVAQKINLMSAFFGALAVLGILPALIEHLILLMTLGRRTNQPPNPQPPIRRGLDRGGC